MLVKTSNPFLFLPVAFVITGKESKLIVDFEIIFL